MRQALVPVLALVCACSIAAQPQQQPRPAKELFAIRPHVGGLLTSYGGSWNSTADVINCGDLTNGSGIGLSVGLMAEYPLSSKWELTFDGGFLQRSGDYTTQQSYLLRDTVTGTDVTMTSDVTTAMTMHYLEFNPDVRFALLDEITTSPLAVFAGPRFALPLLTDALQTESVTSPENGYFVVNGQRTQDRTISDARITTATSPMIGMSVGLDVKVPMSTSTALTAQLTYDHFFTNVVKDAEWTMSAIRLDVGVRFSVFETPPRDTMPPPPPPAVVVPSLVALTVPVITGEILTGDRLVAGLPIVNAVFFDSASAAIPTFYSRTPPATRQTDAVLAHADLFPRLAAIVKANADARIICEGATSGPQSEPDGVALAKRRADAVSAALVAAGIPASRIRTEARVLPRTPSNQDVAEGREENRRVDIIVENAPLQEWVTTQQFATLQGTVMAELTTNTPPGTPLKVDVNGMHIDTTITKPMSVKVPVSIPLLHQQTTVGLSMLASTLDTRVEVDTMLSVDSLPRRVVNLSTADFEAILRFDYNSSELREDVKILLQQLTERLPEGSTITIAGSADVIGSEARNRVLEQQRASNTEAYIVGMAPGKFKVVVTTQGTKFSNATPQGRFLNRCIRVTAVTP